MDFRLTQEQDMLVEAVRSFVENCCPTRTMSTAPTRCRRSWPHRFAARPSPPVSMPSTCPEVGGGGLDYLSQALIERELSKVSWALHVFVARPSKILMACTGEQLGDYLLPLRAGRKDRLLRLTEPGAGSDANSIKTRAVRDGDAFVINGSKHFISHAGHADFAIVFAVTDSYEHNGRKRNAVTAFPGGQGHARMTVRRGRNA